MVAVGKDSGSQESGVRSARVPARTFEDLIVWQKAHAWVLDVYRFSDGFPPKELYTLTSQFRRAAISIPANIAEGFRKTGVADKKRFMNIAQGSLEECRYYLILARDLRYGGFFFSDQAARGSEPVAQRLHSGDRNSWLLTPSILPPLQ